MRIEHVAMYVCDLERARDFFVQFFDGKANSGYYNHITGFHSYFISFDDGSRLEIMNKPGMDHHEKTVNRTGYAHIAFSVGSKRKVDCLTENLRNAGYEIMFARPESCSRIKSRYSLFDAIPFIPP